ncbi:DUF1349 domain-containing protein [Nocardiopsis sp. HNM0947]|uniref:DUF1349 domain-containing protein n=1 Tax=Nocardiopsis coralli TaxID=2772213 RepID=A0ABR9P2N1_9ACTN|nr:DUF1349 domain-containing protein [Nocardiopsis coralli]MBE2998098.1 DUF1349 domain-containing protein [Nocardiopsis coralli]
MRWLNRPPEWDVTDGVLTAVTGDRTDFWRETFYGFVRDDGHVYGLDVEGVFTAEVTFSGDYETLYDQLGLMVRVDDGNWVKAGVEFTDGVPHLSAVVTHGVSDWSVVRPADTGGEFTLRLVRRYDSVQIQYRDGDGWQMLRMGPLVPAERAFVGLMCCSPQRAGFRARFRDFTVTGEAPEGLH